jgi:hypothetical protein
MKTTMNPRIHLYKMRHIFIGDEYAGKYDAARKSLVLVKEHEGKRELVRAWFKGRMGICPRKGRVPSEQ